MNKFFPSEMKKGGFTLIELLVVISIIAILSTVGIASYQGIQARARDNIRKSDLQKISIALGIYAQKKGYFLQSSNESCKDTSSLYFDPELADTMTDKSIPKDPLIKTEYCYVPLENGKSYRLFAKLENCSDGEIIPDVPCQDIVYVKRDWNFSVVSDDLTVTKAPP